MASALFSRAFLEAGLGRFAEARELFGRARALLEEVAPVWMAGPLTQAVGLVELLDGKPAAAERELRAGYETLRAIGEVTLMSTVAGILADAICAQGRYEEAEQYTRVSEESAYRSVGPNWSSDLSSTVCLVGTMGSERRSAARFMR